LYRRLSAVNSRKRNTDSCCVACAFTKNVIVASRLYDVAGVQFTVLEKEGLLKLLQFIQKHNLGNSVPNIVIILRILLTIAVSVATREEFFETKSDEELLKI